MIITLATSLDDISISVRGISNKLRTHNRDFTCRRSKLENAQGGKMLGSTLKRVNYYYYYYYNYTRWQVVLHLEKSELLLGQRPDRARDEGALGESAVELR